MSEYIEKIIKGVDKELEYYKDKLRHQENIIDTDYIEYVIKNINELDYERYFLNKILIECPVEIRDYKWKKLKEWLGNNAYYKQKIPVLEVIENMEKLEKGEEL